MGKLYILMGAPGSGKSTFVKNHIDDNCLWVSRDEVRFSLLNEGDEYFSKENEVFSTFVSLIDGGLSSGADVFADATHLNAASRKKLLNSLSVKPNEISVLWMLTDLDTCLEQNELRKDTDRYVPKSVIRRMYYSIEKPEFEEGIDNIYIVTRKDNQYKIKHYAREEGIDDYVNVSNFNKENN